MKTLIATVVAATGASVCCIGPVVLSLLGAGALGAAASQFEPYRPWLLGVTALMLGGAFYVTYRPAKCGVDGTCVPSGNRTTKGALWLVTVVVVALTAFPYYINWLI